MTPPDWVTSKRQHAEEVSGGGNHMLIEPHHQLALLALVVTLAEALDEAHESLGIIQAAPTTSPLTTILTMRSIAKRGTKHVDEALARYHHGPGATTGGGDG